jgi:hypothetical protein
MLFALLDGQSTIDVEHLWAALAVWRYCDASAKLIFCQDGTATIDPLEQLLLGKIQQEPGINRRGLHRAIGGHVPAKELVNALARLRDQGQARCEAVSTGGRPSEQWFPTVAPARTVMVVPEPISEAHVPVVEASAPLTLTELFQAVQGIGGRLRREGDGCIVDAPPGSVTPEMQVALAEHKATLMTLLPVPAMPMVNAVPSKADRVLTHEEFFGAFQAL